MKQYPKLLEPTVPAGSPKGTRHFDFQFPTAISDYTANPALQNDIVFCGKVMTRRTGPGSVTERTKNPFLERSESFRKPKPVRSNSSSFSGRDKRSGSLRLPATGDTRLLRSDSSCRRHFNSLFGVVKFPVQMELSDMRKRQERREPTPLPEIPADIDGKLMAAGAGKSCWQLIRPLKRKGHFLRGFAAASFGCAPLVWYKLGKEFNLFIYYYNFWRILLNDNFSSINYLFNFCHVVQPDNHC